MLPSIQSPAKRQRTPNYENPRHHSKNLLSGVVSKKARNNAHSPFLPFLYDGACLTSFTSKSSKSKWDKQNIQSGMSKIKQRGGGFRDNTSSQRSTDTSRVSCGSSGVKTHDLQLRFQSAMNVNKGWSIQNPNPRLLKLQNESGKLNTGLPPFSFKNVDDYSLLKRTLAAPHVEYLYQHKHSYLIEERLTKTSGSTAQFNDRFSVAASTAPERRPDRLPEISTPPTHPLPKAEVPSSSLTKRDELSYVHKKSCGCLNVEEREKVPSRNIYSQWERKPNSVQRKKSLQSSSSSSMVGGKVRVKPIIDKSSVSPPKISQKKINREKSLENLRRKAKKVLKQSTNSQDSLEKRRRSLQNAVIKSSSTKKTRNTHELKPNSTSSIQSQEDKVANDVTDRQATNESQDITTDAIDVESKIEETNDHMNDVLTVVETISTAATPASMRRIATPRILKMKRSDDDPNTDDKLSALRKTFNRLDSDGDGHLSFDELKQSLPMDLTKRQLDYIKKIYLMACESTFFGFEEFAAVNQMCDVIVNVRPAVLEAYESMDLNNIEDKLQMYMELATYLDRKQSGSLENSSFKELLASTMNLHQNSDIITEVLGVLNKEGSDDIITSVELLVFIPYLVSITPT